jgi:hypothetical protein
MMNDLLKNEMTRALKLMEAMEIARELEDKYEVEKATRHAKLELRALYKQIRRHTITFEKDGFE